MRKLLWLNLLLFIGLSTALAEYDSAKYFQPTSSHMKEARIISVILEQRHYRDIDLDDSLSSVILDNFIEALDASKNYFLASDIRSFQKYRFRIDDDLDQGNLVAPFYIFNIYKKRLDDRLEYALERAAQPFDYTKDESLELNREKVPYAQSEAELDELWRKNLKSQALASKLGGSSDEEIKELLVGRYERFQGNVAKYNSNDVFEIFMNSVTEAYDPHTSYFTPLNAEDFEMQSKKSLEGIGATLQQDNDFTRIVELRPGGPAFKSGEIAPDDRVVGVAQGADGKMVNTVGWRSDEVAGKIRGPKGTLVRLEILPAGSSPGAPTRVVSLVRDKINLDDAKAKSKVVEFSENGTDYKMGIISIPDFYINSEEMRENPNDYTSVTNDVRKFIAELEEQGVDGVMLDLRNNGGGALVEAINLTGLFLPQGTVVQIKEAGNRISKFDSEEANMYYKGPMNVLINRFSASASEIFAGAIQDYKRGVIVGEQTYGKGTVQTVRPLNSFLSMPGQDKLGLFKYTIATFYRVSGSSTQHLGVRPDIPYPSPFSAEEFGESSKPSALPWDKIPAANYTPLDYVDNEMIKLLNARHDQRMKTDQELVDLQYDINKAIENRSRTVVSLNYNKRKAEQTKAEEERAARVKIGSSLGELEANKVQGRDLNDLKDVYLKESILLLADQIEAKKRKG